MQSATPDSSSPVKDGSPASCSSVSVRLLDDEKKGILGISRKIWAGFKRYLPYIKVQLYKDLLPGYGRLFYGLGMLRRRIRARTMQFPNQIMIEPTNFCQLQCPLCTTPHSFMNRSRGRMKLENFLSLLDSFRDTVQSLCFNFGGEPLLHPHLWTMIKAAHENGLFTTLITNGLLLSEKNNYQKAVASGLDNMIVSVDGLCQETYKQYRIGGNFAVLKKGLRLLGDLKSQRVRFFGCRGLLGRNFGPVRNPVILLSWIKFRHNVDESYRLPAFAKEIGADTWVEKTACLPFHVDGFFEKNGPLETIIEKWIPANRKGRYHFDSVPGCLARIPSDPKSSPISFLPGNAQPCSWTRKSVILWNGDVVPCCYDFDGRYVVGNAFETSFDQVWYSKRYRAIRERMKQKSLDICKACSYAMNFT